jgi:hypothetical protein
MPAVYASLFSTVVVMLNTSAMKKAPESDFQTIWWLHGQAFGSLIDGTENITNYFSASSTTHLESVASRISRCPWPEGQSSASRSVLKRAGILRNFAAGTTIAIGLAPATITPVRRTYMTATAI